MKTKPFDLQAAMNGAKMPEPVAWISTIQCIGAKDYGKDHYGKLPVQSLQQGYYSHTPLITTEQAEAYARAVRDEALARQATVAYRAIDNAKALASTLHEEAQRLKAESNPDALESERQANAILTAEVEKLRKDAERLDWIENQAKESRSGISIDWRSAYSEKSRILEPKGWRVMRYRFLGDRKPSIREAIDAAIRALEEQP